MRGLKLKSFRVVNYRSIEDSGDVPVNGYTALVGKNESGKTSCLKAIHKFNPTQPEPFDGLREFPRNRFHEFKGDEPVVSLTFILSDDEVHKLGTINQRFKDSNIVRITRDYTGGYKFEFPEIDNPPHVTKEIAANLLGQIKEAGSSSLGGTPAGKPLQEQLVEVLNKIIAGMSDTFDARASDQKNNLIQQLQDVRSMITYADTSADTALVVDVIDQVIQIINGDTLPEVQAYLRQTMPKFIYFDNYSIIQSRIHIPSYLQKLKTGVLTPEDKTTRTLFRLVKLDPEILMKLGNVEGKTPERVQKDIDERSVRISRASMVMSGDLAEIWGQKRNRVEFRLDGDFIRIWIADVEGSTIELEQRGKGFQWFFSFYAIFNGESEEGHKNAVLLLDEPGMNLHASSQASLVKFLRKLSKKNQLIYTTHSPFMIDMDALDTVRTVSESRGTGATVSADAWSKDKESLFPLQAALYYSVSQPLLAAQNNLVVQDITDFWYIAGFSDMFRQNNLAHLSDKVVITPAGGASNCVLLSAMLSTHNQNVCVLLNSDSIGQKVKEDLLRSKILQQSKIVYINQVAGNRREMEFEDLFPEEFYLNYVNRAYAKELGDNPMTPAVPLSGPTIRSKIEQYLSLRGAEFHRSKPARIMLNDLRDIEMSDLPEELVKTLENLFTKINEALLPPESD